MERYFDERYVLLHDMTGCLWFPSVYVYHFRTVTECVPGAMQQKLSGYFYVNLTFPRRFRLDLAFSDQNKPGPFGKGAQLLPSKL